MKDCELCNSPARMFCESDQASLCWNCDSKVHSANFLVARHSRSLLCHSCQSPTPWQASGAKLGPTVSVCDKCIQACDSNRAEDEAEENGQKRNENENENDEEDEDAEDEDDDDDDEDDDDDDDDDGGNLDEDDHENEDNKDEEDEDNQVVPWAASSPPPPIATTSSSEESSGGGGSGGEQNTLKRMRQNVDLRPQYDFNYNERLAVSKSGDEAKSFASLRPSKDRKRGGQTEWKSIAILSSLKRFEQNMISGNSVSTTIHGICKLSKDPRAADSSTTN